MNRRLNLQAISQAPKRKSPLFAHALAVLELRIPSSISSSEESFIARRQRECCEGPLGNHGYPLPASVARSGGERKIQESHEDGSMSSSDCRGYSAICFEGVPSLLDSPLSYSVTRSVLFPRPITPAHMDHALETPILRQLRGSALPV